MNFIQLLHEIKKSGFVESHPVVCFTGQSYPLLFFALLFKNFKRVTGHAFKSCTIETTGLAQFKATCEVSFLGETSVIWCSDLTTVDVKLKKEFYSYLTGYKGPHSIWLFTETDKLPDDWACIAVPPAISWAEFKEYQPVLLDESSKIQQAIMERVFKRKNLLPLDECALFINYAHVLSKQTFDEFFNYWFDLVVVPEKSLFDLSSLLFAKNAQRFFLLWNKISSDYAAPFWFVYWSDQLFRAASFVHFSQAGEFNEAKKIAYKLPFSFIKKDWHLYSVAQLMNAHDDLYQFDFQIKNGGSELWLELFYSKFMTSAYPTKKEYTF